MTSGSIVFSIDPGTYSTGVAAFHKGQLITTVLLQSEGSDRYERMQSLLKKMRTILSQFELKGLTVVCEEPHMQGKANTVMQRYLGGLEATLPCRPVYIHPMTVKKRHGHGTKDKKAVAQSALSLVKTKEEKALMKELIADEKWDETDAVAIGLCYLAPAVKAKKRKAVSK